MRLTPEGLLADAPRNLLERANLRSPRITQSLQEATEHHERVVTATQSGQPRLVSARKKAVTAA